MGVRANLRILTPADYETLMAGREPERDPKTEPYRIGKSLTAAYTDASAADRPLSILIA